MSGYDATTYGERIAGVYDDWYAGYDDAAIDFLAGLTGGGTALELGIGTGRLALPLVARGVAVQGIDASEAMVAKLQVNAGGEGIPVSLGDFSAVEVEGKFALVFVVFNTLFALASQEEQVECFRNVAAHLEAGGAFVVEAFVPDLARFTRGQTIQATRVEGDHVMLDVTRHDPVHQRLQSQHVVFQESGTRLYPVQLRYAWPSELDLMARLAGLRLRHRWGGWRREAFTAQSTGHVSVYERAG